MDCYYGIDLLKLNRIAEQLGIQIRNLPGTGELQYFHPLVDDRPRINGRRKDAPRHVVRFVLRVAEALGKLRR